ncbi:MAG: SWIM zinc finger family protein [Nocardioides sp.]|nr:SWIM zinc finger family protein [Nocardioides sp.]
MRAVEEAAYAEADLRRARTIARSGDVGQVAVDRGGFVAPVVIGDDVWTVVGTVPVLDDAGVDSLVETVAAEAGRIGALLAGDLPHSLVEHAEESGVELLPYGGELGTTCTCDAWMDPCPHALAVLYQLTWLMEADPCVLLHLRGLPRDELLARLHMRQGAVGPLVDDPQDDAQDDPQHIDLDTGYDAAVRAARLLQLLGDPSSRLDHLF